MTGTYSNKVLLAPKENHCIFFRAKQFFFANRLLLKLFTYLNFINNCLEQGVVVDCIQLGINDERRHLLDHICFSGSSGVVLTYRRSQYVPQGSHLDPFSNLCR